MTEKTLNPKFNKPNKFQHARRLTEMYCIDLQPFSIVEREAFQKYLKFYDPNINFPSSYEVSSTALNDVYKRFQLRDIKQTFPPLSAVNLLRFFVWMKLWVLNERSVAADVYGAVNIRTAILLNSADAQILFHQLLTGVAALEKTLPRVGVPQLKMGNQRQ
ncbi:hypothetical protein FF38_03593 [Lucilia cuprina]|uniref:Uncharacterized protein n=1 Tax=Lucilia cuprina TaxID=7375 RepID=A0A0L0BSJ2_LUCCU|nr:hypothetical protein FF38_03593 [Lucilia cuprina]